LITGESGTGKELVARALHRASGRSGTFLPVNCGAIPEHLVESELFGSQKGAYTDAVDRKGAFEQADGGSLFLDEIGEMPPGAQVKLLRALEEKEILRLGSSKPLSINVRVIAATNRNIREMIRERTFREDLYYRLGVLLIEVPPLRERREDIPLLAAHFLQRRGPDSKRLSAEAIHRLTAHPWQGNIRELRNVLERAMLLSSGQEVCAEDIHF
ncbi:MAG TPA: sigma-54 dependent transcriptional regulator, partial [Spirochaetia bacterium]|nr:sigma-54 dependent transcriptional regulator [Spirochaetia bacterium]